MNREVKEILEEKKTTVGIRLELPKGVHKRAKKFHDTLPRSFTLADACVELIKQRLAAIDAPQAAPQTEQQQ